MKRCIYHFGFPFAARPAGRAGVAAVLVIMSMVFGGVVSCGPANPLNAEATRTFQIPFPDAEGHYSLQKIEIATFTEPSKLRGEVAEILVDPYEENGTIQSSPPVGHFARTKAGVMVPGDYVSMLAATIQAHTERLRDLNREIGIPDTLLIWPERVGVEANVVNTKDQAKMRNNALFDQRLNALLFVPYSNAQVPVGMNAGVLAHEHFHRIFEAIILSKLGAARSHDPVTDAAGDLTDTILRAMNEGFADYWAWVYTGDDEFLRESLARESRKRSLKPEASKLISAKQINESFNPSLFRSLNDRERVRIGASYAIGTLYARLLKSVTVQTFGSSREARLEGARLLYAALPDLLKAAQEAQGAKRAISTVAIVESLKARLPKRTPEICAILAASSDGAVKCD